MKRPKGQLDPYDSTEEAAAQAQLEEEPESVEQEDLYMTQAEIKRALEPKPLPPPD